MTSTIPIDVLHAGLKAVERYNACLARGESNRMAEMLALQQAPGCSTDTSFFAGVGTLDKQIKDEPRLKLLQKNAKRMGVPLTGNELYQAGLAKFPMDPRACVSQSEGKGKIRKLIEQAGTGCEGAVTVKARDPESEHIPQYRLNPRILKRKLAAKLKEPGNALKDRRELIQEIVAKHGSKKRSVRQR